MITSLLLRRTTGGRRGIEVSVLFHAICPEIRGLPNYSASDLHELRGQVFDSPAAYDFTLRLIIDNDSKRWRNVNSWFNAG